MDDSGCPEGDDAFLHDVAGEHEHAVGLADFADGAAIDQERLRLLGLFDARGREKPGFSSPDGFGTSASTVSAR